MSGVDVFNVTVLKVIGCVGRVEALDSGWCVTSFMLDGDGIFQAVGSEDVLLVA